MLQKVYDTNDTNIFLISIYYVHNHLKVQKVNIASSACMNSGSDITIYVHLIRSKDESTIMNLTGFSMV